jgi:hypothetical protein
MRPSRIGSRDRSPLAPPAREHRRVRLPYTALDRVLTRDCLDVVHWTRFTYAAGSTAPRLAARRPVLSALATFVASRSADCPNQRGRYGMPAELRGAHFERIDGLDLRM